MPQRIEHIDAIARRVRRDVLFVVFHSPRESMSADRMAVFDLDRRYAWEDSPVRMNLIAWLNAHGVGWEPCGDFANTNMIVSYRGQIYIDLEYNSENPSYCSLERYLELPDGGMRYEDATFCMLDLKTAMKNSKHDQPGFWEDWAENF